MSDVKLVLLSRFHTLHEANIASSFLKSKNIDATLFDEHTVNIYATPGIFNGVRLMVPSHQLEKAQSEISQQKEFAENNKFDILGEPCPKCKSTSTEITHINRKDLLWFFLSILFIFPMNKESSREWTCLSCSNTWTSKSSSFENKAVVNVIRIFILILIGLGFFFYWQKS